MTNQLTVAVAALGELTRLFPINQLKLTGLKTCLMQPHIWRVNGLLTKLAVPKRTLEGNFDMAMSLKFA